MKKLYSTFFGLFVFVAFLLLPLFVSAYSAAMSSHHGESVSPCLEHCLGSMEYSDVIAVVSGIGKYTQVLVQKIFFSEIIVYVIPLASLYLAIRYPPPILVRNIKNYNYSTLRGIVIATT